MENYFVKTTLNTPIRDLNLYLLVIGSLAYSKSSALDYVVTEVAEDDSQYTNSDDMLTTEYGQQIAPMNDSLYNVPETTTNEVGLETVGNENISEFALEPSTPMTVQDTDSSVWSRELEIPAEYSAEHDPMNETDFYEELFEDIIKYSRNDGAYLGEFNASVVSFTSSVLKPFFPVMDTSQMISGNFLTKIAADYMYWRNETKYQVSLKHVLVQTDALTCIEGITDKIQVSDVRLHHRLLEIDDIRCFC
uniref:Uncharacterized protein n=1 Tax=Timema shepardi TaxID=629360 RepID=A0A7R9ALL0_TIMSH|nr:unnamed protein product [Timema shepardi]